jgi:alpha-D-ribose 1-methylphosphonate 5-triphosphate synthase subunit PhnI
VGYSSVRGSLKAIEHAENLIASAIHAGGNPVKLEQVLDQLPAAVEKAMAEGAIYDPFLGALAVRQAQGDTIEAAFLLRAYRTTLPRLGYSMPSQSRDMRVLRRVSATFKDVPGGQVLGQTRDYTQRLLDFTLADGTKTAVPGTRSADSATAPGSPTSSGDADDDDPRPIPLVIDHLRKDGLLAPAPAAPLEREPFDVTRTPLLFPAPRSARLQVLARGESGGMLSLAYGALRGYGASHAYVAEVRSGDMPVEISHPLTGRRARIGWLPVTECHSVNPGHGDLGGESLFDMSFGYGITIGHEERRAISMAVIEESLTGKNGLGDQAVENDEYVLHHIDCVEATGFVEHLKLPHYVTFQSSLQRTRKFGELVRAARAKERDHTGKAHAHTNGAEGRTGG